MEEQKQENKKFQKWPIVVLALLVILVIGATFAWFTLTKTSEKVNTIKAGSLSMELDDKASDGILLQKAIPMSYQQGVATTEYTFTLKNNGSKGDYTLSLKDEATYTNENDEQVTIETNKRIADTKIRYILLKDGEVAEASKSMLLSEAVDRVLDSGTIASGTTIRYSLRIWIDSKAENEVMGQIFNARLQLDATQHQEVASSPFEKDSWSTIAANVAAGKASSYTVGDTKTVDLGDLGKHTVRVANTSACTNGETSQTACGFVVEFADIITKQAMNSDMTNVGGWPASEMRTYVNSTIYNALPSDLQSIIADTTVVSGHGPTSGEENFTSTDKLYLLSTKEIWNGGTGYDTAEAETRQLDYYANLGVTISNYSGAIKQYNGSNDYWWLRSADSGSTNAFFRVDDYGDWCYIIANFTDGVSPAFRIA